jgi:hypothetical protein
VATRVPIETAQRIARFAAAHRVAPHVFVRQALALMTASPVAPPDPEGVLADLTKALGLPEYTSPGDVLKALEDLFAALGAPVGDALAANPEPAPPPAQLSAFDRFVIKRSNLSEAEFHRRKAAIVVPRTPPKTTKPKV